MAGSALVGRLRVGLSLDKAAFQEGIKQAKSGLSQFSSTVGKRLGALGNVPGVNALQSALTSIGTNAAAALGQGAAIATTALAGLSLSAINAAGEIQNLSRLSNAMPEEFQAWAAGARSVGIEQDKLADILKDMNDRVGDFISTGGGPMKDFFEVIAPKVGVTADQFRKLSGPQALQLYVDSLEKANVNQQDFTFYMEAIASDSTALLPLLKNGGKAMQEYAARAEALGGVMSNQTVRSLAAMKASLTDVGTVMRGVRNTLGAAFAPAVDAVAKTFVSLMTRGSALRLVFDGLTGAIRTLSNFLSSLITIISSVISELWSLARSAISAVDEFTGLSTVFRTIIENSPVGLIYRMITGFAALIKATGSASAAFGMLKDVAVEVFDRIGQAFDLVPQAVSAGVAKMKSLFFGGLHDMLSNFSWFISSIASGFNQIFGTSLSEAEPFQDTIAALHSASSTASDEASAAASALAKTFSDVSAPLASVAAINDLLAESAEEAAAALSGGEGTSGGLASATDSAGEKGSKAKEKLSELQKVMKALREEADKLRATMGMSELDAEIWEKQREAGVSAASQNGQAIAGLVTQIDAMKQMKTETERGRETIEGFFGAILQGADSAKSAVISLLAQIAQVQLAKGAMALLGQTSWGGGLVQGLGSLVGANANGTNSWQGGPTRLNERGGEILDLPRGTRIIPHDISKRMADRSAQSGQLDIRVGVDPDTGNLTAFVEGVSGNVAAQAVGAYDKQMPQRMQQISMKPRTR
ncbi:hypothetical protein RGQ15_11610 [Paracoccus sp. MBLB3053]|uniref:Bacteriophage tail tape measure C-terminal domain-containing protein n=1 Tax=Paracoccus aurantius TaxID=3073814 RepID=A0ABU2HT40_9RHOB|nr:hypothetical protein [Paracoccus sp. MBLB3053]MDS9468213.1 hypothetical protein [Paracoccus sp. MBLB3053]